MKILITGHKGFIFNHYYNSIKDYHDVVGYDLPNDNIMDYDRLERAIKQRDLVVHSAAVADLYDSFSNWNKNFKVNVEGTYNIAKICAEQGKKLIFISTCCAYGNIKDAIAREDFTLPYCNEPYSTSKLAGEYIIKGMPSVQYVILRIGTVYGVGMRESLFTYIALDRVRRGIRILIHGDGGQTRRLTYIDDLIDGVISATNKFDDIKGETINICGGEDISALKTIDVAEAIIGKPAIHQHVEQRYGQTYKENISIEKAEKLLNFENKMSFYNGMKYCYLNDERFK